MRSGDLQPSWWNTVVFPIPKPNCHDSVPDSFWLSSLPSCMVNCRLISELELNGRLGKRQHTFRAGRGIETYFAELERMLPNFGDHYLIASLILSKTYDTTWQHGILHTLKTWQMWSVAKHAAKLPFGTRSRCPLEDIFLDNISRTISRSVTLFLLAMQLQVAL